MLVFWRGHSPQSLPLTCRCREHSSPDALAKGDAPVTGQVRGVDDKGESGTGDLRTDGLPDGPVRDDAPTEGHKRNALPICRVDGKRGDPPGNVVLDGCRNVADDVFVT